MFTTLIALLVSVATSVSLSVTPTKVNHATGDGVVVKVTVNGPYEGRACYKIKDSTKENTVYADCIDVVSVKEGESKTVEVSLPHAPVGQWFFSGVLPDVEDAVKGEDVLVEVNVVD